MDFTRLFGAFWKVHILAKLHEDHLMVGGMGQRRLDAVKGDIGFHFFAKAILDGLCRRRLAAWGNAFACRPKIRLINEVSNTNVRIKEEKKHEMIQNIIVAVIVVVAAGWLIRRTVKSFKGDGCECAGAIPLSGGDGPACTARRLRRPCVSPGIPPPFLYPPSLELSQGNVILDWKSSGRATSDAGYSRSQNWRRRDS